MSENSPIINPEDVIKKEARGIDNADLGEVQEVGIDYIVTKRYFRERKISIHSKKFGRPF